MNNIGTKTLEIMKEAKWYNHWLLSFIEPYLKGKILEVGAGIGNFTDEFIKYGKVTAIDINKSYIKKLKVKDVSAGLGNIEYAKYFFKDRKFNTIIALNVIEHINDDKKALRNIYKLLNKNGYYVMLVPAYQSLYSTFDKEIGHYRRYDMEDIKKKLQHANFSIISIRYLNWWAFIGWWVFLKSAKRKGMPGWPVKVFNALGRIFLFPEKIIKSPFGLSVLAIAYKKS
jgi:ubiquinone/menaquinone biosynthesis C-methylase UbiE